MKVYTKTGDKGTTALIGGKRVPKYHFRIEAYGTVDELMAHSAVLYDHIENETYKKQITVIQDRLMVCASLLAADLDDNEIKLPQIKDEDIYFLESAIDEMDKDLPPLKYFVLPGGNKSVSFCHVARTVCRRCERLAIRVNEEDPNCALTVKYLNRLSDYYFVLARKLNFDSKVDEIHWIPSF